jgi:hypothetical protein
MKARQVQDCLFRLMMSEHGTWLTIGPCSIAAHYAVYDRTVGEIGHDNDDSANMPSRPVEEILDLIEARLTAIQIGNH